MLTEWLLLGKGEKEFWKTTPRKVMALVEQKKEIEKVYQKNQAIYIACYVWGKDPEDFEENKPLQGVDIPVDEKTLQMFF